MQKRFDVETELIKGKDGVFEVELDGELIFSKKSVGRFPEHGEVEETVAEKVA